MDEKVLKWMTDYYNGNITKEDFLQLQQWLAEDPDHSVFFEQQLAFHSEIRTLFLLEKADLGKAWNRIEGRIRIRSTFKRKFLQFSMAASLLLCGIGMWWLVRSGENKSVSIEAEAEIQPGTPHAVLWMADGKKVNLEDKNLQNICEKDGTQLHTTSENTLVYQSAEKAEEFIFHTIEVPVGGEFNLKLSDGSRVWLNSATTMRYPTVFSGEKREIFIEGEAFFEVSKDAGHPFIVHAGNAQVEVLGTAFNLSAYADDDRIVTTLTNGKVRMTYGKGSVDLLPGKQVLLQKSDSSIQVKKVDPSLYSAWVRGVFEFENLSLKQIGVQLSRWYGTQFIFTDPALAERYFTGGIKRYSSLRESLNLIEHTTNVKFEIVETNVFVKSR